MDENEAMNLRVSSGIWEQLEGRKGGADCLSVAKIQEGIGKIPTEGSR